MCGCWLPAARYRPAIRRTSVPCRSPKRGCPDSLFGEDSAGSLELLCAHSPTSSSPRSRCWRHLTFAKLLKNSIALDRYRFNRRCAELKIQLTRSAGFDSTRQGLRVGFANSSFLKHRAELRWAARRRDSRPLKDCWCAYRCQRGVRRWFGAWPASRAGLAVLGVEGDGKTWAVASWLSGGYLKTLLSL